MVEKRSDVLLESLVAQARQNGFSDAKIRDELGKKGYPAYVVDYYLKPVGKKKIFTLVTVGSVFVVVLIMITFFFGGFSLPKIGVPICADKFCFIEKADHCERARFVQDERGNILEYESKNCVLIKTFEKVSAGEELYVREVLEGKSMECSYEQGFFNVNWVNTLTIDRENCVGRVRDGLDQLLNR